MILLSEILEVVQFQNSVLALKGFEEYILKLSTQQHTTLIHNEDCVLNEIKKNFSSVYLKCLTAFNFGYESYYDINLAVRMIEALLSDINWFQSGNNDIKPSILLQAFFTSWKLKNFLKRLLNPYRYFVTKLNVKFIIFQTLYLKFETLHEGMRKKIKIN